MANYVIGGHVTAWPYGTDTIFATVWTEQGDSDETMVDMGTGNYSLYVNAAVGELVWIEFYGNRYDAGLDLSIVTTLKMFGPFVIDDIGVTG